MISEAVLASLGVSTDHGEVVHVFIPVAGVSAIPGQLAEIFDRGRLREILEDQWRRGEQGVSRTGCGWRDSREVLIPRLGRDHLGGSVRLDLGNKEEETIVVHRHSLTAGHNGGDWIGVATAGVFDRGLDTECPWRGYTSIVCFSSVDMLIGSVTESTEDDWGACGGKLAHLLHVHILERVVSVWLASADDHTSRILVFELDIHSWPIEELRPFTEVCWATVLEDQLVGHGADAGSVAHGDSTINGTDEG